MPTLTRMKLDVVDSINKERETLAKEASKLGYTRLEKTLSIPGELLFAFKKLGIAPLSERSVASYMRSKEKTGMYSGTKLGLLSIACFLLSSGLFALGASPKGAWHPLHYAYNTLVGLGAGVSLIWVVGWLVSESWGTGDRTCVCWTKRSLAAYSSFVPDFVLQKAVDIKRECPRADFSVVYLVQESQHKARPLPDPFLEVSLGYESYTIDVWDERDFEKKME